MERLSRESEGGSFRGAGATSPLGETRGRHAYSKSAACLFAWGEIQLLCKGEANREKHLEMQD